VSGRKERTAREVKDGTFIIFDGDAKLVNLFLNYQNSYDMCTYLKIHYYKGTPLDR